MNTVLSQLNGRNFGQIEEAKSFAQEVLAFLAPFSEKAYPGLDKLMADAKKIEAAFSAEWARKQANHVARTFKKMFGPKADLFVEKHLLYIDHRLKAKVEVARTAYPEEPCVGAQILMDCFVGFREWLAVFEKNRS